jgi:hypothetical protein
MIALGKLPLVPRLRPERRDVAEMFERARIIGRRRERASAASGRPGAEGGGAR